MKGVWFAGANGTNYNLKGWEFPEPYDGCDMCHNEGEDALIQLRNDTHHLGYVCYDCKPKLESMTDEEFTLWRVTKRLEQAA